MRHRDDDLEPFRDDPVVKALTGPATAAELADEAQALAAFQGAIPPQRQRRSAARVATVGTAGILVLAVSGGAAAAYTSSLPDSWQKTLYDDLPSLHFPRPQATPAPTVQSPAPTPTVSAAPPPTRAPSTTPSPHPTPTSTSTATSAPPTPSTSPTLPVTVPSASATATASPSPTVAPPSAAGELTMTVSPGLRVTAGTALTVTGKLTDRDGTAVANRRVALVEHAAGASGRQRLGVARSNEDGEVSFSVPALERSVRLYLRSHDHVRSHATRIVVIPLIHVEVASTPQGATSATVTMTVKGGQPGDLVVVRGGDGHSQQAKLSASLTATFSVPASTSQPTHYRAVVPRTKAHAAHSLAFYVPASG